MTTALASSILFAVSGTAAQTTGTELTIYNQGFALVKQSRTVDLTAGRMKLAIEDVPTTIDPTSVGFRSLLDKNAFSVLEQNYQYDLINPMSILNKSVGGRLKFIRTVGTQREAIEGTLLSPPTGVSGGAGERAYTGMVIKTDDGRIILDPVGEVQVQSVPAGLISKPTLLWDLDVAKAGTQNIELSYIANAMNWTADYVLTLDGVGSANLQGWVSLTNNSGARYENAKLKLLAGDVNVVRRPAGRGGPPGAGGAAMMDRKPQGFSEESLFEYHLYTLGRPATVANNETKQISLLEGMGIKVQKRMIVDAMQGMWNYYPNEGEIGSGDIKPQVRVEFSNSKANGLGMPMPKGRVRVFQRDKMGSVQMLGEDQIQHTPREEKLSLLVGKAFDVVVNRKRTNFTRLSDRSVRETFEIEVRNRKDVPETVELMERHWGDWTITAKSMEFSKEDSVTAVFKPMLKAGEVRKVTYTVETKW